LISLLLPALGKAREHAEAVEEFNAGRQWHWANLSYTEDSGGRLLPGYIHWGWAHPPTVSSPDNCSTSTNWGLGGAVDWWFQVPTRDGAFIEGTPIKPYTLHLLEYFNRELKTIVKDKQDLRDLLQRDWASGPRGQTTFISFESVEAKLSEIPRFGMNSNWVGGHHLHGAFTSDSCKDLTCPNMADRYRVRRMSDVIRADRLIWASTARSERSSFEGGGIREGHYNVLAPAHFSEARISCNIDIEHPADFRSPQVRFGLRPYSWDKSSDPEDSGFMDFRHFDQMISIKMDGSVRYVNQEAAADMRNWANEATWFGWNPERQSPVR